MGAGPNGAPYYQGVSQCDPVLTAGRSVAMVCGVRRVQQRVIAADTESKNLYRKRQ